jgi:hypothetical protein
MSAARPPKDTTPTTFFSTWLPQEIARLGVRPGAAMTVGVRLDGDGGGAWDLRMSPAGIEVGPAGGAEPDVTLLQTVADWRAIVVGEDGGVDLAPPQASPMDLMFVDAQAQAIVSTVKGTVRFEVTGYNGRTWAVTVKFGPQPLATTPDATVTVDAETYAGMLARTIPPAQAFFSGKIQLGGDSGLAMQLGMAMMPRFQ